MNYEEILNKIEKSLNGISHLNELVIEKESPFKILISTILSARTKDANTRAATKELFSRFKTPEEIANADISELERLVYKAGFYKVKAARIKEVSKTILDKFNGVVPNDFKNLKSLPGVGAKTANCVLVYAFNIPAIPVDTHVHRVTNRLEWVKTKMPEATEAELKKIIPENQWIRLNGLFVRFGQQICLPLNPKCSTCPIDPDCPKNFSMEIEKKKKGKKKK
ncbi:MAG TPA: endonuclease III [Candidatus Lokiarchaeia archaeon]